MLMIIVLAKLFFTGLYFSDNKLSNIFSYVSESQWYAIFKSKKKIMDKIFLIRITRLLYVYIKMYP